jgi:hypothetical protein
MDRSPAYVGRYPTVGRCDKNAGILHSTFPASLIALMFFSDVIRETPFGKRAKRSSTELGRVYKLHSSRKCLHSMIMSGFYRKHVYAEYPTKRLPNVRGLLFGLLWMKIVTSTRVRFLTIQSYLCCRKLKSYRLILRILLVFLTTVDFQRITRCPITEDRKNSS